MYETDDDDDVPLFPSGSIDASCVVTCLLLICDRHEEDFITDDALAGWTPQQREEAYNYAMREHLHAGDNFDIKRVPMPPHVRELLGR